MADLKYDSRKGEPNGQSMSETDSAEADQDTAYSLVTSLRWLAAFTGMFVRFGLEQLAAFVGICRESSRRA